MKFDFKQRVKVVPTLKGIDLYISKINKDILDKYKVTHDDCRAKIKRDEGLIIPISEVIYVFGGIHDLDLYLIIHEGIELTNCKIISN